MAKNFHKALHEDAKQKKLNSIMTLQRQNDTIAMLLEGKETKEIASYLANKYHIKHNSAKVYVQEGRNLIKQRKNYEIQNLISLHIHRYEKVYAALYEIGAYMDAQNALKAKEKLLGFHREGFHMKVTQGEIQQIQQIHIDNEYDMMKVEKAKRDRFEELLLKAKRETRK